MVGGKSDELYMYKTEMERQYYNVTIIQQEDPHIHDYDITKMI
jgi:hypothetical protein